MECMAWGPRRRRQGSPDPPAIETIARSARDLMGPRRRRRGVEGPASTETRIGKSRSAIGLKNEKRKFKSKHPQYMIGMHNHCKRI
jgi:hypothetical protein